jgi:hypothetical protein
VLFEIGSTILMGGLAGYSFLKYRGSSTNDADKIQRIFTNANWNTKGETIRLQRKRNIEGGVEYVYQLPLGFDRKRIEENKHILEDGLNVRSNVLDFSIKDFRDLRLNKDIVKQIQKLFKEKRDKKEIEIEFDGMLKIRVYNEQVTSRLEWSSSLISKGWLVPIGLSRRGMIYHDFDSNYFMIVAGAAGFGKSQFIKMLVTTLTMKQPENIKFHLIDLKGGLAFSRFKDLKQVADFGKDRDSALKILKNVQNTMNKIHDFLEKNGFEDVKEAGIKERHFVVIDEAADLTDKCQDIIEDIARRGRACGLRMIYATQYPTNETLRSQVRQNALARVCFKLKTNVASRAVLDEGGAEELPEIPGRAIYQTTSNKIVQTVFISNEQINKLIYPHVIHKGDNNGQKSSKTTENRKYSLNFEEVRLHDKKPASNSSQSQRRP